MKKIWIDGDGRTRTTRARKCSNPRCNRTPIHGRKYCFECAPKFDVKYISLQDENKELKNSLNTIKAKLHSLKGLMICIAIGNKTSEDFNRICLEFDELFPEFRHP